MGYGYASVRKSPELIYNMILYLYIMANYKPISQVKFISFQTFSNLDLFEATGHNF